MITCTDSFTEYNTDKTNDMKLFADLPQKCKHAFIEFWKSYYMENVTVLQNTQIWLSCKNDSILQSIHTNGTDKMVCMSRYMNSSSWTCEYEFNFVFMIGNQSVLTILGIAYILIKFRFSLNTNFDAGTLFYLNYENNWYFSLGKMHKNFIQFTSTSVIKFGYDSHAKTIICKRICISSFFFWIYWMSKIGICNTSQFNYHSYCTNSILSNFPRKII